VIIELPQVGESISEGVIGKWLKNVGDSVEKFDPLVEIITDKVAMELPSPISGILKEIIVAEGQTVPIGAEIANIESEHDNDVSAPPELSIESQSAGTQIGTTGELLKNTAPVGPTGSGGPIATDDKVEKPSESSEKLTRTNNFISPVVARVAEKNNVDLSKVVGTGKNGRITKKDVQSYIGNTNNEPKEIPDKSNEDPLNGQSRQNISPIRKIIATNMVKSATLIPQAWTLTEVDVTGIVNLRQSIKENFLQQEGINITYLPFVLKAVAQSLKTNPLLNSSWQEDHIIINRKINIGIAASTDDGLVVPVIHDSDTLSITGLAQKVDELTKKSREGNLAIEDVSGGTFTLNNTGVLGSIASQPLVNYPQAAIMTTEAITKRPMVVNDGIAIRSMMNICLSFDHRIMDGKEAGAFNSDVKQILESINTGTQIY
tara:strand:- start:386 stop:1681 length:1296 start_codon:yes stop_codon:yes gene_type:complete